MAKFNSTGTKAAVASPIVTESTPTGLTHEGAPGYVRDAKGELFLLGVSNMVGEETFYESAADRDRRFRDLVHQVAVQDPDWMGRFLKWLRSEANMRSAPLVGALEAAKALLGAGKPGARQMVASVLQRADEPGEALAYWTSTYGRAIPKPVKRGVADAVARLYSEYALLKYDTSSKGFRFADVLDLVHPSPVAVWQGILFMQALERRHGRPPQVDANALPMVTANAELRAETDPQAWLNPERLKAAGMTWEDALSAVGSKVDKAQLWSALIPSMGYMALLRNLRNFDESGVTDETAQLVLDRLTDPEQVRRSRQLPFRFFSAYRAAPSLRWGHALDKALSLATRNIPAFGGKTLVLVDTSASMQSSLSAKSSVTPAQAAALFGVSLAARGEQVDLRGFADGVFSHEVRKGASVLKEMERFIGRTGEVGHGTHIASAVRASFSGHDRVVIISDMQTMDSGTTSAVPANVAMYGFNLGGYRHGAIPSGLGARHEFGGLSDATFRLIPLLEAGRNADWPF